jgi:hypothetical protein
MANLSLIQVTVPGCKVPLQAIRFPDGAIGATLRSLCAALLLSYAAQSHRLKRAPALNGSWRTAILKTAGGRKSVDVLYVWAIPLWAAGIQTSRLDAAKRDRILILQREAVPAIYRAFWQMDTAAAAPIESETASGNSLGDALEAGLEARLAAIEAMVRDLAGEVAGLTGRDRSNERLLAATIERLLWLQNDTTQRSVQQRLKPSGRRRGRPRRADPEKR